jgi:hypothetical protein
MTRPTLLLCSILSSVVPLSLSTSLLGQQGGQLRGSVKTKSQENCPVAHALVVAKKDGKDSGQSPQIAADSSGGFVFVFLEAGKYTIEATDAKTKHCIARSDSYAFIPNENLVRPDPTFPDRPISAMGGGQLLLAFAWLGGDPGGSDVPSPAPFGLPSSITGTAVGQGAAGVGGLEVDLSEFAGANRAQVPPGVTDRNGNFSFPMQPDGLYSLEFRRKGGTPVPFIVGVKSGLPSVFFTDGTPANFAELHVENTSTPPSPFVDSVAQTIESTRRLSFESAAIASLPLRGIRNIDDLALLAPGVAPPAETPGDVGPGIAPGLGTAGEFSVNGLRGRDNNFNADGEDDRDDLVGVRRQGFFATTSEPADAIEEYQIFTSLADSRSWHNLGAEVNSLSRTGTARFRGSVYGLFTSDVLRSGNLFSQNANEYPSFVPITTDGTLKGQPVSLSLPSPYNGPLVSIGGLAATPNPLPGKNNLLQAQGGLNISGTISKYVSGLFAGEVQGTSANQLRSFIMPTFAQRGWFGTGATGFSGNYYIGNGNSLYHDFYPASLPGDGVFSLLPLPNNPLGPYGPNTFTESLPASGLARIWSGKVDFRSVPALDSASIRYNRVDDWADIPAEGNGIYSSIRPRTKLDSVASFANTHVKSVLVEMRASWGRSSINFDELRDPSLTASSVPGEGYLLNAPLLVNTTSPGQQPSLAQPAAIFGVLEGLTNPGLTNTEQLTGPLGQLVIAGFSPAGVGPFHFPQSRTDSTFQAGVTFSHHSRSQSTYWGVDGSHLHLNQYTNRNAAPMALFAGMLAYPSASGSYTQSSISGNQLPVDGRLFDPLSLAAAGIPIAMDQTLASQPEAPLSLRRIEISPFFHRYQRLGSRFHLNFGARLGVASLPGNQSTRLLTSYNPNNLASDVGAALKGCASITDNVAQTQCVATAEALNVGLPVPLNAALGVSRPYLDIRGGFAWDVRGNGLTVVRGGGGTYHGQFPANIIDESRSTLPNYLPINFANAPATGNLGLPVLYNIADNFLPGTNGPVLQQGTLNLLNKNLLADPGYNVVTLLAYDLANAMPILSPTGPGRNLQGPWAINAALEIEQQIRPGLLASVAYVGTRGRNLLQVTTPDQAPGSQSLSPPTPYIVLNTSSRVPDISGSLATNHQYLETLFESQAFSSYNSLQLELRGNLPRLQFGASFTWSKALDNASDFYDLSGAPALPDNSINPSERGPSNFDTRLRGTVFFVWDTPRSSPRLLNGWRVAGILSSQTGQPYTVNSVYDVNGDGNLTDRPVVSPTSVQQGNLLLVPPAASMAADLGLVNGVETGSPIGRNTLRMPRWSSADLAVSRSFGLRGGKLLTPRVEIFNAFNSVRLAIPDRWLGSPAFGLSDRSLLQPRLVQFVLRCDF